MGAARTVAVPAKATNRARHRCVALIEASGVGLNCALLLSFEPGMVAESNLARSCKALVLVSLLLLLSATRRPVKGLHGYPSWRIASSEIVRWHGQPKQQQLARADLRAEHCAKPDGLL